MAEEDDASQGNDKRFGTLEKHAKFNSILIYVTMVLTALAITSMIIWVAAIGLRIEQNKPPSSELIEKNLDNIDKRLANLFEQITDQQQKMKDLEVRIGAQNEEQSDAESSIIQNILISQQRDYDTFLKVVDEGIISLSQMVKGSRTWTKQTSLRIKKAQKAAKAQIKEIEKLQPIKSKFKQNQG